MIERRVCWSLHSKFAANSWLLNILLGDVSLSMSHQFPRNETQLNYILNDFVQQKICIKLSLRRNILMKKLWRGLYTTFFDWHTTMNLLIYRRKYIFSFRIRGKKSVIWKNYVFKKNSSIKKLNIRRSPWRNFEYICYEK